MKAKVGEDGYLGVEQKRVNLEVEKVLVKNRIKVPGIGLQQEFFNVFDKKKKGKDNSKIHH